MAAKPRINLRFRGDLWDGVNVLAKRRKSNATAVLEDAAKQLLRAEGFQIEDDAPAETNGHGPRVAASAAVKAGVKPIPKGGKR